jgi:hypothetical protein
VKKYLAYHVDLRGIANASYELKAAADDDAKAEAAQLLRFHPAIEVWDGARWVARIVREGARHSRPSKVGLAKSMRSNRPEPGRVRLVQITRLLITPVRRTDPRRPG